MKKFKRRILFVFGLTSYRKRRSALKLAAYYRSRLSKNKKNGGDLGQQLAALLDDAFNSKVGEKHNVHCFYQGQGFKLTGCSLCKSPYVVIESEFNINADLAIILETVKGVEHTELTSPPSLNHLLVIFEKDADKKEMAEVIGKKVNEYILL